MIPRKQRQLFPEFNLHRVGRTQAMSGHTIGQCMPLPHHIQKPQTWPHIKLAVQCTVLRGIRATTAHALFTMLIIKLWFNSIGVKCAISDTIQQFRSRPIKAFHLKERSWKIDAVQIKKVLSLGDGTGNHLSPMPIKKRLPYHQVSIAERKHEVIGKHNIIVTTQPPSQLVKSPQKVSKGTMRRTIRDTIHKPTPLQTHISITMQVKDHIMKGLPANPIRRINI